MTQIRERADDLHTTRSTVSTKRSNQTAVPRRKSCAVCVEHLPPYDHSNNLFHSSVLARVVAKKREGKKRRGRARPTQIRVTTHLNDDFQRSWEGPSLRPALQFYSVAPHHPATTSVLSPDSQRTFILSAYAVLTLTTFARAGTSSERVPGGETPQGVFEKLPLLQPTGLGLLTGRMTKISRSTYDTPLSGRWPRPTDRRGQSTCGPGSALPSREEAWG